MQFLNNNLESLFALSVEQREVEERAFRQTFRAINQELQDDAFRRFDAKKNKFLGAFSIACFEVVALGMGFNTSEDGELKPIHGLANKIKSVWSQPMFTANSGSGVRASVRVPRIVPMGRELFSK